MSLISLRNRVALTLLFWIGQLLAIAIYIDSSLGRWKLVVYWWVILAIINYSVWRIGRLADVWERDGE